MRYRRDWTPGGTWFFTTNLADRRSRLLVDHVDLLREAVRTVRERHPFEIIAMVVLPDHLHAIWRLPDGDADHSRRWALIKAGFSRRIPRHPREPTRSSSRRERGVWQRRYWEHLIRDERDLETHVDYIHFNPTRHGHVDRPSEWPYSSIHRYIREGWLDADWASEPEEITAGWGEAS